MSRRRIVREGRGCLAVEALAAGVDLAAAGFLSDGDNVLR